MNSPNIRSQAFTVFHMYVLMPVQWAVRTQGQASTAYRKSSAVAKIRVAEYGTLPTRAPVHVGACLWCLWWLVCDPSDLGLMRLSNAGLGYRVPRHEPRKAVSAPPATEILCLPRDPSYP